MNQPLIPQIRSQSKVRIITYWIITAFVAFELIYGACWDFNWLNQGYVHSILKHLGYPLYLGSLLGICKMSAAVVILMPGVLLLKEWAYAGLVILFIGAFVSHLLVGDSLGQFIWSFLFGVFSFSSWALRPTNRWITMNV